MAGIIKTHKALLIFPASLEELGVLLIKTNENKPTSYRMPLAHCGSNIVFALSVLRIHFLGHIV